MTFAGSTDSTPAVHGVQNKIKDKPGACDDVMFWQFPARTEGAAYEAHQDIVEFDRDGIAHIYLGLPWATWIDFELHRHIRPVAVKHVLQYERSKIAARQNAAGGSGRKLCVHTVCQHIYWKQFVPVWEELGITDLWISHLPAGQNPGSAHLTIHPWHLFAVNVEDPDRRLGLEVGKEISARVFLASFIGNHLPHYLSDVRLRLRALADKPRFFVNVTDEKWHFEDVVYGHQIAGRPLSESYRIGDLEATYNSVLSDSVFALCPSGAGPNTLRLWEALAVGSVPVLLGPQPALPQGGSLPPIDWGSIVIRVPDDQIEQLPILLRRIPLPEVRRRQRLGMEAYALVREQRCF